MCLERIIFVYFSRILAHHLQVSDGYLREVPTLSYLFDFPCMAHEGDQPLVSITSDEAHPSPLPTESTPVTTTTRKLKRFRSDSLPSDPTPIPTTPPTNTDSSEPVPVTTPPPNSEAEGNGPATPATTPRRIVKIFKGKVPEETKKENAGNQTFITPSPTHCFQLQQQCQQLQYQPSFNLVHW
jgi:hypothetical protein